MLSTNGAGLSPKSTELLRKIGADYSGLGLMATPDPEDAMAVDGSAVYDVPIRRRTTPKRQSAILAEEASEAANPDLHSDDEDDADFNADEEPEDEEEDEGDDDG